MQLKPPSAISSGWRSFLSVLGCVLVASHIAVIPSLFAGPLSDRSSIEDLPTLPNVSGSDKYDEHKKITKIEYELAGCAWGCRRFSVYIGNRYVSGNEFRVEFVGVPDHAEIRQFLGTEQGNTFGRYFGKADYGTLHNLLDFIVHEEVYNLNGTVSSDATDQYSTFFSITRNGKSSLVALHGSTHQYEIEMTVHLINMLIKTAEYTVPAEYKVLASGIVTNRGNPVSTRNISRNEALSALDTLYSKPVERFVASMSDKQQIQYGEDIRNHWNDIRWKHLSLIERANDFVVFTFEYPDVGRMELKLRPICDTVKCKFRPQSLAVSQI